MSIVFVSSYLKELIIHDRCRNSIGSMSETQLSRYRIPNPYRYQVAKQSHRESYRVVSLPKPNRGEKWGKEQEPWNCPAKEDV